MIYNQHVRPDYQEMVERKADEIAQDLYQEDLYALSKEIRHEVWNLAEEAVTDFIDKHSEEQRDIGRDEQ